MKIKFVGLQDQIFITFENNGKCFQRHLIRNEWMEISDDSDAEFILKSPYFISEKHLIFDHKEKITGTILINRSGALGDLIQLIPVIKYMKKNMGLKFSLWTNPPHIDIMKWFNVFENVFVDIPKEPYDTFLILDGVLESDHSISHHHRTMHRIKIFEEFFKIEIDKYDFSPEKTNVRNIY